MIPAPLLAAFLAIPASELGRMYDHDINPLVTKLAKHYGFVWQDYYGPALLSGTTAEGATVGLSCYRIGMLTTFLDALRQT